MIEGDETNSTLSHETQMCMEHFRRIDYCSSSRLLIGFQPKTLSKKPFYSNNNPSIVLEARWFCCYVTLITDSFLEITTAKFPAASQNYEIWVPIPGAAHDIALSKHCSKL